MDSKQDIFDPAALLRASEAQIPEADFCGEDFLPALQALLDALRDEARLTPRGQWAELARLIASLNRRRRLSQLLAACPELGEIEIEAPIFVLGFPRTGTTMLHNLLGRDPQLRTIPLWEMREPFAPVDAPPDWVEATIARTKQLVDAAYQLSPRLTDIHPLRATWPDECSWLFRNAFASFVLAFSSYVPGYVRWLAEHDDRPAYAFFRLQLQAIQAQRPGQPLALKDPCHIWHLEALLETFPDARVIQLHRRVDEVVASFCSLCHALHEGGAQLRPLEEVGAYACDMLELGMQRMLRARAGLDEARFLDLDYRELVGDPLATMAKIHAWLGLELGDRARAQMQGWLEGSRSLSGRHRYSLDRYGLGAETLRERFFAYEDRFATELADVA